MLLNTEVFNSAPVQLAAFLGLSTLAAVVYFALVRAGSGLKGTQQSLKNKGKPVVVTFFTDPNSLQKTQSSAPTGSSHMDFQKMLLISKTHDTHDTIVLRFALPHHGKVGTGGKPNFNVLSTSGIAPSKHVQVRASINGEMVQRSFSPTSCAVDEAHCGLFDLHIKVYRPDPSRGLGGGVMSTYLDSLAIGSTVEMRGPTGLVEYAGNGAFLVGTGAPGKPRKIVAGKHLVLIAGGSGITPIVAVLKAILHGKLGGMRVPQDTITGPASPTTAEAIRKAGSPEGGAASASAFTGESSPSLTSAEPLARREYLKGECRHSFYEYAETCLDESSNGIERITFIYANHTVGDVMFKDWLIGEDKEHSCFGAFAALAEAGFVKPQSEAMAAKVPDNFTAKSIDLSMNLFVTRPTPSDTKAMAAANQLWEKEERALWGLPSTASGGGKSTPRGRSNSKGVGTDVTSPLSPSTKTSAVVTRRYVTGRPTEACVASCMAHGGSSLTTSAIRDRFAAQLRDVEGNDTVALLCGPNGLLNEVAKPALLAAGLAKERILLA